MRILHLALIASLAVPATAAAQTPAAQTTAEKMLAMARQIRASAEQLKDSLPAEDRAQMIRQAEEIEQGVRDGAYAAAAQPPKEKPLSERLLAEHGGRLEWLTSTGACAGYTQENYLIFRYASAINDRDSHCRNAYGHWATYIRVTRDGEGAEASEKALFYYDAAAKRALALQGGK